MDESGPRPRVNLVVNLPGAVSAGTYAAGVLDFLVEALDAYHADRDGDDPRAHDIVLCGLSGASAGAQTALILASSIAYRFEPLPDESLGDVDPRRRDAVGSRNPFFRHWVEMNDLRDYLTTRDDPVESVLDSTNVDRVVRSVLDFGAGQVRTRRPWVADHLRLGIALTNLRGTPTAYGRRAAPSEIRFTRHADAIDFNIAGLGSAPTPGPSDGECALPSPASAADKYGAWYDSLGRACVASGAFPLVFRPRLLDRPETEDRRSQPAGAFCAVDGGVFDNDPQDIAARIAEASGRSTVTVILTIGPPSRGGDLPAVNPPPGLPGTLRALLAAVWNEARFRPDALTFHGAPDEFPRFLVTPDGPPMTGGAAPRGEEALRGAGLGGFAGYFAEAFRAHDFMLGRRNARAALSRSVCLAQDHPLFCRWTDAQRRRHLVVNPATQALELPVVPLRDALARSAAEDDVPTRRAAAAPDVNAYAAALRRRVRHVLRGLVPPDTGAGSRALVWIIAWPAAWWISGKVLGYAQRQGGLSAATAKAPAATSAPAGAP